MFILVSSSESDGRFYVLKLSKNLSAVLYKFLFKTYVNFSTANYLWMNLKDDGWIELLNNDEDNIIDCDPFKRNSSKCLFNWFLIILIIILRAKCYECFYNYIELPKSRLGLVLTKLIYDG